MTDQPGMTPSDDITCRRLVELVTEYLEGALPPALSRSIEEHLEVCDGCRLYVGQMRLTIHALRTLGDGAPLDPALRRRLLDLP
ncbi:MAG TPA: zf-HC2 domain-containing protein [Longimicrobiales bacterium]